MEKLHKSIIAGLAVGGVHYLGHNMLPKYFPDNVVLAVGVTVIVSVFVITYYWVLK